MNNRLIARVLLMTVVIAGSRLENAAAQSPSATEHGADLSGVWTGMNLPGTSQWSIYTFSEETPPMTEWALARFAENKPQRGPNGVPVAETNDLVYQCFPPGTPRIYIHPFPVEIVQTPGRVMMIFEYDHLVRQIYTDGRDHRTDLSPSWMGDSTGHWEGDVLVVESLNFNDKTWITRHGLPHSEEMRLTERIQINEDGNLQIDMQIDDPIAFKEPWVFQRYLRKTDWTIAELTCMDNATYKPFEDALLEFNEPSN
jgi:hypothetical protein